MLSAIIHKATTMDTLAYARETFFDPLGIQDVQWEWSPHQHIGYSNPGKWSLTFSQDRIDVVQLGVTRVYRYAGTKR